MKTLVNTCVDFVDYGNEFDIIYNALMSHLMYLDTRKAGMMQNVKFGDYCMCVAELYKYICHIIYDRLRDDDDMKAMQRNSH